MSSNQVVDIIGMVIMGTVASLIVIGFFADEIVKIIHALRGGKDE